MKAYYQIHEGDDTESPPPRLMRDDWATTHGDYETEREAVTGIAHQHVCALGLNKDSPQHTFTIYTHTDKDPKYKDGSPCVCRSFVIHAVGDNNRKAGNATH